LDPVAIVHGAAAYVFPHQLLTYRQYLVNIPTFVCPEKCMKGVCESRPLPTLVAHLVSSCQTLSVIPAVTCSAMLLKASSSVLG
jgi:hypothetical protein